MARRVTIIGGGLSGLALGIRLRESGVEVVVHEAATYPRHKVCGEFVSGGGVAILPRLGLLQAPVVARTVQLFRGEAASQVTLLPEPAWCMSRYELDHELAQRFEALGGILKRHSRFTGAPTEEGVVRASGRQIEKLPGAHVVGLKLHARGLEMAAELEMHFGDRAYVGVTRVENGRTNICGLFRVGTLAGAGKDHVRTMVELCPESLRRRLEKSELLPESFCAVAGLPLEPRLSVDSRVFAVGDALAMLPPVTGNGMSFALESAEIAAPLLAGWAEGNLEWQAGLNQYQSRLRRRFASRIKWARWLHRGLFSPIGQRLLFHSVRRGPLLGWLFRRTR